ncbi:sucrose phosphorylase [Thiosulfatimonas sediminis]|uniref:Sucrose phosphorylase n=1 Tax=Thiosulfatimonas sediminis TaxID=2675054 RepID=A0A6F8PRZ2_9GAMM|nr:sugar phosphorylase [Thiosulfatimonas sediminis]BBP44902.1 sucrose phosphorylase [Thiosulfatimonas sediminis]
MTQANLARIKAHLQNIYEDSIKVEIAYQGIVELLVQQSKSNEQRPKKWDQKDALLITYGDSFLQDGEMPLVTLQRFLDEYVKDSINCVHILPFFPYSSDDGFSVIDYLMVDPDLGDWTDIAQLNKHYDLMFDLVINHVSRESLWFTDYKAGRAPYTDFFIDVAGDPDLSQVTRPRNTPLLVPAYTHHGRKKVWATFSADQIDLNFANPLVLVKMLQVLMFYVQQGSRIIRLDAIAFLWKKIGTPCVHLLQTHEAVKLMRSLLDLVAPDVILLTETNVPHQENLSYFGESDEAHMVYQFSLAPLILHALHRGDGSYLTDWASHLEPPPDNCTFLNFTASHDGVGLRPVEGILPQREVEDLVNNMHRLGGFVSMKSNPDGTQSPYEINITYFSALRETHNSNGPDQWQVERFICSQNMMMCLQGVPAFYVHSLTATPNDRDGVEKTGRTRSINRRKWDYSYLQALIGSERSSNAEVIKRLTNLIKQRKKHKAFDPHTPQRVVDLGSNFFILWRAGDGVKFPLLAVHNLTAEIQPLDLTLIDGFTAHKAWVDLLAAGQIISLQSSKAMLQPYQSMWLMPQEIDGESALWAISTN